MGSSLDSKKIFEVVKEAAIQEVYLQIFHLSKIGFKGVRSMKKNLSSLDGFDVAVNIDLIK